MISRNSCSTTIVMVAFLIGTSSIRRQGALAFIRPTIPSSSSATVAARKSIRFSRLAFQFQPASATAATTTRLYSSGTTVVNSNVDEFGRRSRAGRQLEDPNNNNRGRRGGYDDEDDDWNIVPFDDNDDFPPHHQQQQRGRQGASLNNNNQDSYYVENNDDDGGWDDFDPFTSKRRPRSPTRPPRSSPSRGNYMNDRGPPNRNRSGGGPRGRDDRRPNDRRGRNNNNNKKSEGQDRKINMKALEGAGFVHLYGLASCLNALDANVRDFSRPEDAIDMDLLDDESRRHEEQQRERKPEAQFSPWLFVQDSKASTGRSTSKARQAQKVLELAQERGLLVAHVDKGTLNTLSGNRPHQGYVLRCGKLQFESVARLPLPGDDNDGRRTPDLWLALDEVVDPQNLGALLRSAYFLGGNNNDQRSIGVLVCAKNSAPPSPVVSASSAGALEFMTGKGILVSTNNLPRTLASAEQDGFRIIGASSSIPRELQHQYEDDVDDDERVQLHELEDLPPIDGPTILVLGSEGHGLRSLVARSCTEFVRISGGENDDEDDDRDGSLAGVDSLNVSVTGGILLWQLLRGSA